MHLRMGPEESYSRRLDNEVAATEMPYGYDNAPLEAMHELSESRAYEEAEESAVREGKKKKRLR